MFDQLWPRDDPGRPQRACEHVLAADSERICWFFGAATDRALVCRACAAVFPTEPTWVSLTPEWQAKEVLGSRLAGYCGSPGVLVRETRSSFVHDSIALVFDQPIVDLAPVVATRDRWAILLQDGTLVTRSLRAPTSERVWPLVPWGFSLTDQCEVRSSRGGRFVAVLEASGSRGAVFDTATGAVVRSLDRKDYRAENSRFSFAFVDAWEIEARAAKAANTTPRERPSNEDATLIVTATDWNRLDVIELSTGRTLSQRELVQVSSEDTNEQGKTALDYFHGALAVSPRSKWIVDSGWYWAPLGADTAWSMDAWLGNVFESEDGPSRCQLVERSYFWDGPVAWLDEDTIAVWGYGDDDENLVPAALICSLVDRSHERWFAGPTIRRPRAYPPRDLSDTWVFDRWLFSVSDEDGTCVWDVATGERIAKDATLKPRRYHAGAKEWVTLHPDHVVLSRFAYDEDP